MTKVKFELECLKKLLKRDSIVKIVNELPDKETADLNYIYIIPKEGEGKDKKAYVLRPDRSGFDTIDLTPQLVNVVGEGHITVEKETLNENGDVTFTVTTSSSLQAVLDSLSAKDSEQDTRLAVHDTDISNLKAKDSEINTTLETLGTSVGKVTELVESKAQGLDTRVKALEAKEDSDKQTLAVNGNKLSISNGNEVDLPQYDDTELNDALDDLEDKLDDVRDELEESKENIKQVNDYTEQVKNYLEGKVNVNKDAIDANKADADAKNNALTTRVNVLEEAKPVVENKLTEIEAKNTAQDEKITALENRTDNFINNVAVSKADGKVKLTYSRVDGSSSEVEFEDSDTISIAYDDEPLKTRIKALEDKEDKDTIYNDTEVKQGIKANENAIQGVENDLTVLRTHTDARLEALENKEDKDTIYDDSAVRGQITALESKVDGNKTAQDGKNAELDAKDKEIDGKITALENKVDNDNQTLTLEDHTLSISGGNAVTLPEYDDTVVKAKNKEQDEEIKALKEKTKSFLTGANVTRQGNVVTLTYTNIDGSSTNLEFNDNDTKAIAYDDTALKARVQELENREGNGTIYNDTPIKERLNALENKVDKDTVYDDAPLKERITALETKEDKDTHYNVKSTTNGLTVVKSQENGEEVFTINADLAFNKYYTKGEVDNAIADNNKRTQKLVKYNATWKSPAYFRYTNDGRVPVLSHNNVTSFGSMKLDGVILKPMSANTIICEFPPNTPKPIEFIEVQAYIGNEPISMWYIDRTVRVTDVPQSLVGKRVIFNFVGLFA